jgi:antibiotic biosynthesis monooxygenase (ABM) superfamily enzyme
MTLDEKIQLLEGELRELRIQKKYEEWQRQAEEMAKEYPGFDLHQEAKSDKFCECLGRGYTVKEAYDAAHNADHNTKRYERMYEKWKNMQ